MINFPKHLYLASKSPRRADLLKMLNIEYTIKSADINEEKYANLSPIKHVLLLSELKAEKIAQKIKNGYFLGADTIVVLDNKILGKPQSRTAAYKMLKSLSGREHLVFTGFTLMEMPSGNKISRFERTKVKFKKLSDVEINNYLDTGSPMDKAGSYGIQDEYGSVFVEKISGCYYNVVGLPLSNFFKTATEFIKEKKNNKRF